MANNIFHPGADAAPPLDTVLLWLTATVERDFEQRSAFPQLRGANAKAVRAAATLYYLTADEADAVLEDAAARGQSVRCGMSNAYNAHSKSVQAAMKEACERPAAFASPSAACTFKFDYAERWRGTKDQITAHGIQLAGPWPQEPGGKRWAQARDSRGYKTSITRFSTIWPGLYEAFISIPYQVREAKRQAAGPEQAEKARASLASMPANADAFRANLVSDMRNFAAVPLRMAMEAKFHGYTLDEGALGEIHASFDAVGEAVVGAQVKFDPARHAEIACQYRAEIAAADQSFQGHFAALTQPNPCILEGGTQ